MKRTNYLLTLLISVSFGLTSCSVKEAPLNTLTKKEIKERERKIAELIEWFCTKYLDDEYLQLSQKLLQKMSRKRQVPFARGKLEIWAAAIIYAIGSINFLGDKSFEPYMKLSDISKHIGLSKKTVSGKARDIRNMFNMQYFDKEFSTKKMIDDNPFNNMVMVDDYMVPLSSLPEDLQEMARKARAEGKDIAFRTK